MTWTRDAKGNAVEHTTETCDICAYYLAQGDNVTTTQTFQGEVIRHDIIRGA